MGLLGSARARARHVAARGVRSVGGRLGLEVLDGSIYSPVPQVPDAGDPIWSRPVPGLTLDAEAQLRFVEDVLAPHIAEFATEVRDRGFELWNGFYQAGDAEVLYALVRHAKPRRILEIGSGFSTHVAAAACRANAAEGRPVEFVAVDPSPRTDISGGIDGLTRTERRDCRELPVERFRELESGDILFIDSSHAVKLGSEVNWLFLEVLQQLRPGVHVHVHDVFLPYEYPRYLFDLGGYFSEQYLLHALLIGNDGWEIELALCALAKEHPERLAGSIPSLAEEIPGMPGLPYVPGAFWMRRRADDGKGAG